jgi:SAM-dependent methyltransferase
MCRRVFQRFLGRSPGSILDVACGTGRDIRRLHRDCTGIDLLPKVIDYAKVQAPEVGFHVVDMRSFRLGRTFDVILCFGSAILYALTNDDLDKTFATFAAHSNLGSILIMDCRNGIALLGDGFKARIEGDVQARYFSAHWVAKHCLNRPQQRLIRKRRWEFSTGEQAENYCDYRLLFPLELERMLSASGLQVLSMFDNKELRDSDFPGPTLCTIAQRKAEPGERGNACRRASSWAFDRA